MSRNRTLCRGLSSRHSGDGAGIVKGGLVYDVAELLVEFGMPALEVACHGAVGEQFHEVAPRENHVEDIAAVCLVPAFDGADLI